MRCKAVKARRPIDVFKPVSPPTRRERRDAAYPKDRLRAREAAWNRASGRCIFPTCRRSVTLAAMHGHELVFRSKGGDPTDQTIVVSTCGICHAAIHTPVGGRTKRIEGTDARGPLRFYEKQNGEWVEVG